MYDSQDLNAIFRISEERPKPRATHQSHSLDSSSAGPFGKEYDESRHAALWYLRLYYCGLF